MPAFRTILVAFVALLFVFSTNWCALAAAFPHAIEECCPGETPAGDAERGLPCAGWDCAPCATLDSGVHLAALVPLMATAPMWMEDTQVSELMRRLAVAAVEEMPAPPDPAAIPPPPWRDVMMQALPVRGPSLPV